MLCRWQWNIIRKQFEEQFGQGWQFWIEYDAEIYRQNKRIRK